MSGQAPPLATYAKHKRLSQAMLSRWQAWAEADQQALLTLAQELQLGENQLRDFFDWLEDIVARDGGTVAAVLQQPAIRRPFTAQHSRNDKLKAVKDALRKLRYPRLSRLEEELKAGVKALDLGRRVRLSFPPAFEGDEITVEIKARNVEDLHDTLTRLQQRLDDGSLRHLFHLLDEI